MTFRSVPWTSQPQGAVEIDWSNPITRGLAVAWSATNPTRNLVNGAGASSAGTGVTDSVTSEGVAKKFSGAGTGKIQFSTFPETNQCTFFCLGNNILAGTVPRPVSNYNGVSNGVSKGRFDIYYDVGSSNLPVIVINSSTSGFYSVSSAGAWFAAGVHATAISYDGSTAINTPPSFFCDGLKLTTTTVGAPSGSFVTAGTVTAIGGRPDITSSQFAGSHHLVLRFNRALSDSEARSLSANPYQIFQPRKLPIFVDIPVDHNIYAYTDESAITNETSEYPSTGSVFNDGSQDTNSVTDSSIKVYTAQTTLNDTNSVVDNQTAQAQLYAARSEVNNAVESISALAQLYAAKTESFAATETSTQGASSSNTTTDSIGVTDSSTRVYTSQATLSDSNTSTDSITVQAQFYAVKTEAATTLDSLLVQASLLAVKLETASPTDSRNTSSTFVAAQLNTVNIIDTYAAIASLTAQLHTISNSIEVLLGNSISSANTIEITIALDDFYALLEQLIYQLSQVVFMNETLAFTLIPISRTTSLRAEARNTTFNSSIRLNQFLATKPITTYIRT